MNLILFFWGISIFYDLTVIFCDYIYVLCLKIWAVSILKIQELFHNTLAGIWAIIRFLRFRLSIRLWKHSAYPALLVDRRVFHRFIKTLKHKSSFMYDINISLKRILALQRVNSILHVIIRINSPSFFHFLELEKVEHLFGTRSAHQFKSRNRMWKYPHFLSAFILSFLKQIVE